MARALSAYLKRDAIPARQALQQSIRELKFPLSLDETYAPLETAGYLPCALVQDGDSDTLVSPGALLDRAKAALD